MPIRIIKALFNIYLDIILYQANIISTLPCIKNSSKMNILNFYNIIEGYY